VGILGPRQVGKTTLARDVLKRHRGTATFLDLEDPADLARLADARLTLEPLRGLVVIDEIQRRPDPRPDRARRGRVARVLLPWSESLAKRQVRSPKVYLADSGILHALLGIRERRDLERHPKLGASWEGFALEAVVRRLGVGWCECHFWATHGGAELDLLVVRGRRRWGFEFKRTSAPALTRSMRVALEDLRLERLDVVHGGPQSFLLAPRVRAVAFSRLLEDVTPLR
jgi:predicted AAA+ superfamily ATPase